MQKMHVSLRARDFLPMMELAAGCVGLGLVQPFLKVDVLNSTYHDNHVNALLHIWWLEQAVSIMAGDFYLLPAVHQWHSHNARPNSYMAEAQIHQRALRDHFPQWHGILRQERRNISSRLYLSQQIFPGRCVRAMWWPYTEYACICEGRSPTWATFNEVFSSQTDDFYWRRVVPKESSGGQSLSE